jgi:hypothetical protein
VETADRRSAEGSLLSGDSACSIARSLGGAASRYARGVRLSLVSLLVGFAAAACGSSVSAGEPGAQSSSNSSSATGSGGAGGTGIGGGDACGCDPSEVCHEANCVASRRLRGGMIFMPSHGVFPFANTLTFVVDAPRWAVLAEVGSCRVEDLSMTEPSDEDGYHLDAFDVGAMTVQLNGGAIIPLGSWSEHGVAGIDLSFPNDPWVALDPAGGDVVAFATAGVADLAATPFSTTTQSVPMPDPMPPLVPGQPWTITWSEPGTVTGLSMRVVADDHFLQCRGITGDSLTVDGSLTAFVAAESAELVGRLIREQSQVSLSDEGVELEAVIWIQRTFSVPVTP